ncbi:hypothetical protein Sjap_025200 [Stephania japonica]|uniref:Uncharacterized protein n=1 Tax=Stephania japonica TaxID=461633 RepID=A0AAP0E958_9MAGN
MANLSQGSAVNRRFGLLENANNNAAAANAAAAAAALQQQQQQQQETNNRERKVVEKMLIEITDRNRRENAINVLSKLFNQSAKKDHIYEMIPQLWNSFGCIAALLQEIVSIYPYLSQPNLSTGASNRVSNAIALLQGDDNHNTEVINFLLRTEVIPLCLRSMEMGSELSKTVATFVLHKILKDDVGLNYITDKPVRFYAVGQVLTRMVSSLLSEQPLSIRLLKNIIRCYLRLSENARACEALRDCLPGIFRDPTISRYLREDQESLNSLQQLLRNVHGAARHLLAG